MGSGSPDFHPIPIYPAYGSGSRYSTTIQNVGLTAVNLLNFTVRSVIKGIAIRGVQTTSPALPEISINIDGNSSAFYQLQYCASRQEPFLLSMFGGPVYNDTAANDYVISSNIDIPINDTLIINGRFINGGFGTFEISLLYYPIL